MPLKENFRTDSLLLLPYWILVFLLPSAFLFSILAVMGAIDLNDDSKVLQAVLLTSIPSVIFVYYGMRRWPTIAYKTIVITAALFTFYLATSAFYVAIQGGGGLIWAIVSALLICIPSYFINRYALTPKPDSPIVKSVIFFI
ncbi:MAG: hypothetical protein GX799_08555 [Crenarchaeota archaeon]|jgi:hypothetical protein|nr:hypothetical protein [Thermoproteota archaeon]